MRRSTWFGSGAALIVLGVAGLIIGAVTYPTEETLIDIGSIEASATVEEEARVPPELAGGLIGAGIVLLIIGGTRAR